MKNVMKSFALGAALLAAPFAAQADGHGDNLNYVLVSHAPDSDSWWNTIKNGIALAGEQVSVNVEYRNPPTGDIADMARIIEQAAASSPDGIITTLADFDVLKGPIMNAVDQGIEAFRKVDAMVEGDRRHVRDGDLVFMAKSPWDVNYQVEKNPELTFSATKER